MKGKEAPPDELARLIEAINKDANSFGMLKKSDEEEIDRAAEEFPDEQYALPA